MKYWCYDQLTYVLVPHSYDTWGAHLRPHHNVVPRLADVPKPAGRFSLVNASSALKGIHPVKCKYIVDI